MVIRARASLPKDKLIGEISALFFDEIIFTPTQNKNIFKPTKRKGKRIGRYNYVVYKESENNTDIMQRVIHELKNLVKPTCVLKTHNIDYGKKLMIGQSVMEFECTYCPDRDPYKRQNKCHYYSKRIVFKGKRKEK